ncbi:MAG: gliding motility-associated C-terminal domain-containing protein [Bacteroidetes bacterium]|nr:gliding motility-associated C-terminal domain-containing protein [Bacteroidota bacterium]
MRKHLHALFFVLFCFCSANCAAQIYSYTSDVGGAPAFVITGLTASNLTKVGGGTNTPCASGFSGFTVPTTYTSYSTSDPAINVDITPANSYVMTVTSVSVGIRRSGTGPNNCRLAYSVDGGVTWTDKGTDDFPYNGSCGQLTTATWTFPCAGGVKVGYPNYFKFRLFYFNSSNNGGTTQVMNLTLNGSVTNTCTPPTASISGNASFCNSGSTTITFTGTPNATVTYTKNNGPNQTIQLNCSGTATLNTGVLTQTTVYSLVSAAFGNCSQSQTGTATVTITVPPVITTTFTNPTTCSGSDGNITINGLTTGTSYTVHYLKNLSAQTFTATAAANSIVITGLTAGSYTNIYVTVNGCNSNTVAGPITLVDPPTPSISSVTYTDPTTCGGTDGTITLHGLLANTTYTLNYALNNVAQGPFTVTANASGDIIIANLAAGTYSNITVTRFGCTSNVAGPVTLFSPQPPVITNITFTNPTTCNGTNGTITLYGLLANTTYFLYYTSPTGPVGPVPVTADNAGHILIGNLQAGTYSNFYVTWLSCTSNTVGPVTLVAPVPPVIANVAAQNPATCTGANGSLFITGLLANTAYTVFYNYNASPQSVVVTSDASGNVLVASLISGTYDNVYVSLNNCPSNIFAGPFVLIDPAPPVITSSTHTDPTTCLGVDGSIVLQGLQASTSYILNYNKNAVPQGPVNVTSDAAGNLNMTNLSAGTYDNISVTLSNCLSNILGPVTLVDPTAPSITNSLAANPTTCGGTQGSITLYGLLPNTAYSLNYDLNATPQGPVNVVSDATGNVTISGLAAGIYNNISLTRFGCLSNVVGPFTLADPVPPAPPAVSNVTYCQFDVPQQLTATGINLLWYNVPTGGIGDPVAPTPSTATAGLTPYYVTQTTNGCESQRAVLVVTVNAKPAAPVVVTPVTYCQYEQAIALSATGQNLLWYNTPTGGVGNAAAPIPSTAVANSTDYYVSQSLNGCESDRSQITVIVGPTPAAPAVMSPVTYCQFDVPSQPMSSYVTGNGILWYTAPIGGIGDPVAPVANTNTPGSTTYYVTQSLGNCESSRSALTVNINPKPQPPTTSDITYCQGEVAPPLTANGQNLLWYTMAIGGVGTPSLTPSTATPGAIIYYVSQSVNSCESERSGLTVTVKPKPSVPTTAVSSYTYCQFDAGALPLLANGANLQWYDQPIGGTPVATAPVPSTTTAGTFTWYVTQTMNGCESDRLPIVVTVNAKPLPPVVADVTYCQGDAATPLTATGQNLKWYDVASGGIPQLNAPLPVTADSGVFVWYVSQTTNGCESDRAAIKYIVYFKPDAAITAQSDSVCQHDTLSFTYLGNGTTAYAYNWSVAAGATILSGTGQGPVLVRFDATGDHTVSLVVDNNGCKSPLATYTVHVKDAPDFTLTAPTSACPGDTISVGMSYVDSPVDNYNWNFDGAKIIPVKNQRPGGPYLIKWEAPGMHTVSLLAGHNGCSSPLVVDSVNVFPRPEAKIMAQSRDNICAGDTILLSASTNDPTNKYWWYPGQFFDNGNYSASILGAIDFTTYVKLQVTSVYGCKATDSVLVTTHSCCHVEFPTAFSPNGDGNNDNFRPITVRDNPVSYFRIFNRWGKIVFESLDVKHGWNGAVDGVAQDIGTYFYQFQYSCEGKLVEQHGEFTLVR